MSWACLPLAGTCAPSCPLFLLMEGAMVRGEMLKFKVKLGSKLEGHGADCGDRVAGSSAEAWSLCPSGVGRGGEGAGWLSWG